MIYKITTNYPKRMEFYLYISIIHLVENLSEVINNRNSYTFSLICGRIPRNLVGSGPGIFSCLNRLCLLLLKLETNQIKNKNVAAISGKKNPINLCRTKRNKKICSWTNWLPTITKTSCKLKKKPIPNWFNWL